jgi:transposase
MINTTFTQEEIIAENKILKRRNEELQRQVNYFQKAIFGSKSEKQTVEVISANQPFFEFANDSLVHLNDDEILADKNSKQTKPTSKKKKKKGGNQLEIPENVVIEEVLVDLPEDEKKDPITGEEFSIIDYEVRKKLVYIPGHYKLIHFKRPVYGSKKCGIIKPDFPGTITGASKLDESFWAFILVMRFCDHLPYYRIAEILKRDGLNITRQSLNKGALEIAIKLVALGELLKQEILQFPAIGVDETFLKMQKSGAKKLIQAYMWVLCGSPPGKKGKFLTWMNFKTNRKHANAVDLIEDYNKIVHSDAFEGYEKLADAKQFHWAPCWVHARRYFINATEGTFQKKAVRIFSAIMHEDNKTNGFDAKERVVYRQKQIAPMVEQLIKLLEDGQTDIKVIASESLSRACSYFLKRKEHFKTFLDHADAEMDNNAAERIIRPLKIGVKNWLFIGSQKGGDASAVMYSLLQSARSMEINPREYLENVLRRLPYTKTEDLHELLPHKWQKKINPKSPFLPPDYKL